MDIARTQIQATLLIIFYTNQDTFAGIRINYPWRIFRTMPHSELGEGKHWNTREIVSCLLKNAGGRHNPGAITSAHIVPMTFGKIREFYN